MSEHTFTVTVAPAFPPCPPKKPRCKYCGAKITDSNPRMTFPLYFGTGYATETVNGCRWCAGLDDYTD
jgi:hypothetical protein